MHFEFSDPIKLKVTVASREELEKEPTVTKLAVTLPTGVIVLRISMQLVSGNLVIHEEAEWRSAIAKMDEGGLA